MSDVRRPRSRALLAPAAAALMSIALAGATQAPAKAVPAAAPTVTTVMSGLSLPWDVAFFKNGDMLMTERRGTMTLRTAAGARIVLNAPEQYDVFNASESGAMGVEIDPTTKHTYFYTCQSKQVGGKATDIRVYRWRLAADSRSAVRDRTVASGLPITSGRHAGCRVRFTPGYRVMIGTGDAATGTNPQSRASLGGKTLRIDPLGGVPSDNPYAGWTGPSRLVYSYGHRNVQGLAVRPGTNQVWSQEQGTFRDDETNLVTAAGNYGYDPVPGYNEQVPMTDTSKFPQAIPARWSSGSTTVATSGITFLQGSAWGRWNGALAVAELKGQGVRVLTLNSAGQVTRQEQLPALNNAFGRIRTVQSGPGGALYATTSNGSNDKVLRLAPYAPPA